MERKIRTTGVTVALTGAIAALVSGQMAAEYVDSITTQRGHEHPNYADYSWTL